MYKKILMVSLSILFMITSIACFVKEKTEISWQQSEGVAVHLGVRDKFGSLKKYNALFVVKDSKGKEYKLEKGIKNDNWGYVSFPDDFDVQSGEGEYTWKCIVGGKVIVGGRFRLSTVNTFCDQATVSRL
jgi:hypothetical protein